MPFENNIVSFIESAIPLIMLIVFIIVFLRAYLRTRSIKESAGFDRRWYEQQRRWSGLNNWINDEEDELWSSTDEFVTPGGLSDLDN